MPGCFSPTEILAAHECGADIVKVFPATMLGPQFIKDVRAPLPQVKLMPTGGVTLDNAGDWIRAGAVAVGLGSALLDAKAIDSGRFDVITANARKVVANVAAARSWAGRPRSAPTARTIAYRFAWSCVPVLNELGISNPLRYSRVSRRSACLSSTNFSALPSNASARPTRYEMLPRCGSVDDRCPSRTSQVRSFGSFARIASTKFW